MSERPSLRHPPILLATWFGSGYLRPAPGTWGTAAALPFAWAILHWATPLILILSSLVLFAAGIWAANRFDAMTQGHDASEIVVDEVVGVWLTLGLIGLAFPLSWAAWVGGFFLFRLFDIVKPFPIRQIDRSVGGGFGVMIDDVLAGLLAGGVGILILRLFPAIQHF